MHESPYNAGGKKEGGGNESEVEFYYKCKKQIALHAKHTPGAKKKMEERTHYVAFTTTFIMCNSHRRWTEQKKKAKRKKKE